MTLDRRALLGGMASAAALSAAPWPARAQDVVTLRLHHFLPPQATAPQHALAPWARQLAQASGGRLKVQLFPSMQLGGKPSGLLDQAREGVVDMVWTVLGYTPGRFPRAEAFELPFMTGAAEAGSQALHAYVQAHAMAEFAGVKLIAAHTHGPGTLHSRVPIQRLEDVKGLRVRGGSRVINNMLEQVGAVPVGMPVPQVGEALSRGVLAAATLPWEVVPALKIQQMARHHTGFAGARGLYTQTFALVMNQARYDRLPADLKQVLDAHSGVATAALFGRAMDAGDQAGLAAARQAGNRIVMLDEAETRRWQAAAAPVRTRWFAEARANGIDGEKLAAEAERLVAHYSRPV